MQINNREMKNIQRQGRVGERYLFRKLLGDKEDIMAFKSSYWPSSFLNASLSASSGYPSEWTEHYKGLTQRVFPQDASSHDQGNSKPL